MFIGVISNFFRKSTSDCLNHILQFLLGMDYELVFLVEEIEVCKLDVRTRNLVGMCRYRDIRIPTVRLEGGGGGTTGRKGSLGENTQDSKRLL